MKNIIMGAIALLLFSISILVIQSSCSKSNAQGGSNAVSQIGKIIFYKNLTNMDTEIWLANYDGTGAVMVPVILPANVFFDGNVGTRSLSISPDGQKIFFTAQHNAVSGIITEIYACNIDGSNVTLVSGGHSGHVHAF